MSFCGHIFIVTVFFKLTFILLLPKKYYTCSGLLFMKDDKIENMRC